MIEISRTLLPDLPKLAWAASLDLGQRTLWVIHGPAVECRDQWLVEGTWDGPFEQADFHHSANFFGSGIRIDGDQIHFVPSAAPVDRLLYCVYAGRLYVSNSLILLLSITGARLDPGHNYHEESNAILKGFREYDSTFKVSHPLIQTFFQIYHNNIVVSSDGAISIQPKPRPQHALESFADYHDELTRVLHAVYANCKDAARSVRLDLFSTISTGYDSAAVSTLVSAMGVTKAFNSRRSNSALPPWLFGGMTLDDASHIARTLRMEILPLDPWPSNLTEDELYFYAAGSAGAETIFASMADYVHRHCQAAVVFTGHPSSFVWDKSGPPDTINGDVRMNDMAGQLISEMRLKSGFIHAPVKFIMATESEAIHRIASSQEMKPWSLGNSYDRPIPRRILEQAGVERESFGQHKKAVWTSPSLPMNNDLRKRFLRFLSSKGIRHVRVGMRINKLCYFAIRLFAYIREVARTRSIKLDPQFGNRVRTRQRIFHKRVDFLHLLHLFSVDALVQRSAETLLRALVDGRWKDWRPNEVNSGPRCGGPTSAMSSPYPPPS